MRVTMRAVLGVLVAVQVWGAGLGAEAPLRDLLAGSGLPARVRVRRGVAQWDQVDRLLNTDVLARVQGRLQEWQSARPPARSEEIRRWLRPQDVAFSDLFSLGEDDFLPLTNSLLRMTPELSLVDLPVYRRPAEVVGTFAGKSRFEKSGSLRGGRSYVLITFEYRTGEGDFRSAGTDNLLDSYLVRWRDIRNRPALDLSFLLSP